MIPIKHAAYRAYQALMRVATCFLDFTPPKLINGPGSLGKLPALIKSKGIGKVLIVTDAGIAKLGLLGTLIEGLQRESVAYAIFDRVQVNPTIANIEDACSVYMREKCRAFIAFGGGSPMDCAKAAGARVSNPRKTIKKMRGLQKVTRRPPLLFAVPTTAGTGSETTVAAIVSDPESREKFAITDPRLIPRYAILDPLLTARLPPIITATTGMDALTHAVEAYIGRSNTKGTREAAEKTVRLVFGYLEKAFSRGEDIEARSRMLEAAHFGGIAFTRAYVGYVHAIAHNLGGLYGVPHGLANAVILPYVLEWFGDAAAAPLARLAEIAGVGGTGGAAGAAKAGAGETAKGGAAAKAATFIEAVRGLNSRLGISDKIPEIRAEDIPLIVERAFKEAHPLYPVPRFMREEDCIGVIRNLMPS